MGYEDDNGVLNFAVMDGRRWGYLGLTHSFSVRSRHTPLFLLVHFGFSHARTRRGASLSLLLR